MNTNAPLSAYAGVNEMRRRAEAMDQAVADAKIPAWLCRTCRRHLHDPVLRTAWSGGRHDADDTALIERTLAYLQDPNHRLTGGGACAVCRAGSKYKDEVLT
jgi:hypothetical protein